MKRLLSLLVLLTTVSWCTWADETITVSANSEDISQALDLKAVATLFGTVKNVEEFETMLNNPDSAFTNLDLNGDGGSKRQEIKQLLKQLRATDPKIDMHIFRSVENVNLRTLISYHDGAEYHHFLDDYDEGKSIKDAKK